MVSARVVLAAASVSIGAASLATVNASSRPGAAPVGSRDTFVHLFEWSWSDVATECETYLGPKGFTAVQISPPNDHIAGPAWWTRYQPVTYDLVSRSGDENGFQDMVRRCSAAGVGIYADAVINHIAAGSGKSIGGKSYGNRATRIYSQDDIHHNDGDSSRNCGVSDYSNKHNVQYCDLVGLPDLCTSCSSVQDKVSGYINHMSQLGISGFRVDAAKHMDAGELGQLLSKTDSGLFRFHEVISGGGEAVQTAEYTSIGHVTEFDFFRKLDANVKDEGKLQYLDTFGESWGLISTGSAVTFIDNHDTQRGEAPLTYKDGRIYELASIFMLAHPYGYPKIMSSYFFDDKDAGPPSTTVHASNGVNCFNGQPWVCEHRWSSIGNMVNWRKSAGTAGITDFQTFSGNTIAFCRGNAACVAMNRGGDTWNANVKFSVPAGTYCNVIEDDDPSSCPKVTVNGDGSASFQVPYQRAVAVHIGKKADGNQIVV
jgi:alpha-amylase